MTDLHPPSRSRPLRWPPVGVGVLLAAAAFGACADCAPVIVAYAKAEATRRFAVYMVDSMSAAPKGDAFQATADGSAFVDFGKGYRRMPAGLAASEGDALQRREKDGKARCEPLGDGKVGNDAVVGYRIRGTMPGPDLTAIDFWVGKASGLPMYHSMGPGSGLRWVYGPAVSAPAAGKMEK